MAPNQFKVLYNQAWDALKTPDNPETKEPQERGYEIGPREIREHYNADGSMKEAFKGQYLALGYTSQQIREFESETYRELKELTSRISAYEHNYGFLYPVEEPRIDDPPEQVKAAVNLQAIREGEGLTELAYAIEPSEYYDIQAGSRTTPVEEMDVYQLYPETFTTDRRKDDFNRF